MKLFQDACDGNGTVSNEAINGAQPLLQADEVLVSLDVMSSSLLSVQSAPALEAPARPRHLPLGAYNVQSPPDTNLEEEDNLLTISSLTARPLIAKSKELGKSGQRRCKRRSKSKRRRSVESQAER